MSSAAEAGLPWEQRRDFSAFIKTVEGILTHPSRAFEEAAASVPLRSAWLFLLITIIPTSVIMMGVEVSSLRSIQTNQELRSLLPPGSLERLDGIVYLVWFTPVFNLLGVVLTAVMSHFMLVLVGGAKGGFQASFRATAYSLGSTAPIALVPIVGSLIAAIWASFPFILGLVALHQTTTRRVVVALTIPVVVVSFAVVGLFVYYLNMITHLAG